MNTYKQIVKALHEAKTGPISDMDEIVKQYSKSANYKRNLNKIESLISEAEKIYKKIEEIAKETDYFKEDSEYKKLVEDLYKKYFDIFDLADKSQIFIGMYDEKNKEIINYNDYITVVYQPGLVGKGSKPTEKFLPRYSVTMQSVESPDIPMYKRLWNKITTGLINLIFPSDSITMDLDKVTSTNYPKNYKGSAKYVGDVIKHGVRCKTTYSDICEISVSKFTKHGTYWLLVASKKWEYME